jgi:hypothetical protein
LPEPRFLSLLRSLHSCPRLRGHGGADSRTADGRLRPSSHAWPASIARSTCPPTTGSSARRPSACAPTLGQAQAQDRRMLRRSCRRAGRRAGPSQHEPGLSHHGCQCALGLELAIRGFSESESVARTPPYRRCRAVTTPPSLRRLLARIAWPIRLVTGRDLGLNLTRRQWMWPRVKPTRGETGEVEIGAQAGKLG